MNQISRQLEYGVSKSDPKVVDSQIGFVDPEPKFIEFDPCLKQVCGRPDSNISKLTISSTNSCDESGRNMFLDKSNKLFQAYPNLFYLYFRSTNLKKTTSFYHDFKFLAYAIIRRLTV